MLHYYACGNISPLEKRSGRGGEYVVGIILAAIVYLNFFWFFLLIPLILLVMLWIRIGMVDLKSTIERLAPVDYLDELSSLLLSEEAL